MSQFDVEIDEARADLECELFVERLNEIVEYLFKYVQTFTVLFQIVEQCGIVEEDETIVRVFQRFQLFQI